MSMEMIPGTTALLCRVAEEDRPACHFFLDGRPCTALQGDTVLTAVLSQQTALRHSEFAGSPRAGFCLMGACQDCWIWLENGRRIRACSTLIQTDMAIFTKPPVIA